MKLLIACYNEHKHLFGNGKTTKKEVFQRIALSFNKKSHNYVTGDQCMRKWVKLENKFKDVENHNNKSGNGKITMKFYDLLVECIGEKRNITPEIVIESTSEMLSSSDEESDFDTESSGKSSVGKKEKRMKRKRKSHSSAAEMLSFLSAYTEKREKTEEEKLKLMKDMKEEKTQFFSQLLEIMKNK